MLRGLLLTGGDDRYMRHNVAGGGGEGELSGHTLWWPPTKIAGRYVSGYLFERDDERTVEAIHSGHLDIEIPLDAHAPPGTPNAAHARLASEVCDALGVDAGSGLSESGSRAAARPRRAQRAAARGGAVARRADRAPVRQLHGPAARRCRGDLAGHRRAARRGRDPGHRHRQCRLRRRPGGPSRPGGGRGTGAARADRARRARRAHARAPAAEVVVGDLVALGAGDRVPADGRVVEGTLLQVDESALTGESLATGKRADPPDPADAPLAERHTSLLAGTTVTRGAGRFVVTATGAGTEMGRIAGAAARGRARTPLQARLDRLSKLLIPIAAGICATLALLAYLQGDTLAHSVLVGVSLAVAALPEGLPAVVTITLALSMRQMAEHGAIVRRLAAVETLGSTTVICSDKTGTLTENRLAVQRLWAAPGFTEAELLEATVLASRRREQADPLELAILAAAEERGIAATARGRPPRRGERPFDSERKRMSVVVAEAPGASAFVKGAPDVLTGLLADARGAADADRCKMKKWKLRESNA